MTWRKFASCGIKIDKKNFKSTFRLRTITSYILADSLRTDTISLTPRGNKGFKNIARAYYDVIAIIGHIVF